MDDQPSPFINDARKSLGRRQQKEMDCVITKEHYVLCMDELLFRRKLIEHKCKMTTCQCYSEFLRFKIPIHSTGTIASEKTSLWINSLLIFQCTNRFSILDINIRSSSTLDHFHRGIACLFSPPSDNIPVRFLWEELQRPWKLIELDISHIALYHGRFAPS